jgi:hypothetical protein
VSLLYPTGAGAGYPSPTHAPKGSSRGRVSYDSLSRLFRFRRLLSALPIDIDGVQHLAIATNPTRVTDALLDLERSLSNQPGRAAATE